MKISEFLAPEAVVASMTARDKPAVLRELAGPLARSARVDPAKILEMLVEREEIGTTGVGEGVAIPHGKLAGVAKLTASFGVCREGLDFQAYDGRPTFLFFALIAPENAAGVHLKALARISRLFKNATFRASILHAVDAKAIYELIVREDETH